MNRSASTVARVSVATAHKRVLIVDDDTDWCELMALTLSELGYQPLTASSGPAALALLDREPVDVLLLDLNMPGMSGEEVAANIPPRSPPIVFLTSADPGSAGRAMREGPHYYLPKTAKPDQLALLLGALAS